MSGTDNPRDKILMSTETTCHFSHLLQVSKNLFQVWFYTIFFYYFIHVYSPEAGPDNPSPTFGMKFWCQQEHLVTLVIWCKFKKNLFEVWFYTYIFHDFIHVYSPGAVLDSPQGTKFDFNRNVLSLHSFVASFKKMSLKSDFKLFFSWFNTCI